MCGEQGQAAKKAGRLFELGAEGPACGEILLGLKDRLCSDNQDENASPCLTLYNNSPTAVAQY